MTATTSFRRVFAGRVALGAALLASACQDDSNISFDDTKLKSPVPTGTGGAAGAAGSHATAGSGALAGDSEGGSAATGGSASAGSTTAGATTAGATTAGSTTGGSNGGMAGTDVGGTTNHAGKAGQGGSAGATLGDGGMAGASNSDPITIVAKDLDDTHLNACDADSNFCSREFIEVDGDGCVHKGLIKAEGIDIPGSATVSVATLTLTCMDASDVVTVSYANDAWDGKTVSWNGAPDVGATLGTVTCSGEGAKVTIDLTAAYQAWVSGAHPAQGIYFTTNSDDGAHFASSEAPQLNYRPKLSITYTVP